MFFQFATYERRNFYNATMTGSAVTETDKVRQVALERAAEGNFGVAPANWFARQTEKINLMKKVEGFGSRGNDPTANMRPKAAKSQDGSRIELFPPVKDFEQFG